MRAVTRGERRAARSRPAGRRASRSPVRYDGPDLAEVAAEVGLTPTRSSRCTAAASTSSVLRLLPRLRLPGRTRRAAARAPAAAAAHRPSRRERSASPASSPASTRGPRPAVGGCSATPTRPLWDATRRDARTAAPRAPACGSSRHDRDPRARPAGHRPGPRPARLGGARRAAFRGFDRGAARLANRLVGNAPRRSGARGHPRRVRRCGARRRHGRPHRRRRARASDWGAAVTLRAGSVVASACRPAGCAVI